MKIVHTADWHWSETKLDRSIQSSQFILERLKSIRPDLHVIAGDFWDRRQVLASTSAVIPAVDTVKALAAISPLVVILGNHAHDVPGSLEIFKHLYTPYPIYITERAETILLYLSEHGHADRFENYPLPTDSETEAENADAIIHLFPYPNKSHYLASRAGRSIEEANREFTEKLQELFVGFHAVGAETACPKIFVGHCNVREARISGGEMLPGQEVMISKHDLDLVGADYYALGHIHLNQELRNNMWYAGSIYHHDFGETEEKYFNVVDIEQGQVSVRRERIITRPLSLHIITIGTDGVIIRDESKANDWHGADLRVRVHLSQEQVGLTSDEEIIKHFPGAATYHIQRIVTPEERVRSENISLAKTLRSRLIEWACTIDKILPAAVLTKADEMEAVIHSIEP